MTTPKDWRTKTRISILIKAPLVYQDKSCIVSQNWDFFCYLFYSPSWSEPLCSLNLKNTSLIIFYSERKSPQTWVNTFCSFHLDENPSENHKSPRQMFTQNICHIGDIGHIFLFQPIIDVRRCPPRPLGLYVNLVLSFSEVLVCWELHSF